MGNLNQFFRDLGRNAYGLGENVASLGSAAIAEPVAGFAAMYDPANGAQAIREGMTYTPRTQAGQMYQQGAARTLGAMVQPAMPVIDAWQKGVDIAGRYSPATGAALQTVPTALGALMGYKPAMQTGRQVSNSLGAMQARMVANANAPSTLNTAGFRGQRGVFAGINALTADKEALAKAQQMIAQGVDPADVWKQTGWGQGADGKWRFEINDSGSSLNMMNFPEAGDAGITSYLPEFLKHPQVYQNYPESKTMGVLAKNGYGDSQMRGGINGLMVVNSAGGDTAKSTVLHELQHAIQQKEGFASGGSPSQFDGLYNNPHEAYRRLGGEVEARMVQNRMDLTPEQRRDIYPFAVGRYGYEDIPKDKQIFSFGNNKANAQRPLTEFEQAHLTAQRNAALPVNQGGLGLAADNTAMDRARAMGFDVDNPVYHGTNWDFWEFNRVGEKANALGLGHYTTPNPKKADMYGDRVMPLLTKNEGVLDWGNLTDAQRKEISANLKDRVPNEDMAGYAPLSKKQFPKTENGTSEAKAFFREKQKETSNYFHDRAKPNIVDDGDNWAIEWRDPTNMDGANNQDLLNLSQRFDPDIANALGYKGAKFGDETAIYDNKNIRSRFAAFDPMQRQSSNLLAQSAKFAPAATLGALMANEKRKDKRN